MRESQDDDAMLRWGLPVGCAGLAGVAGTASVGVVGLAGICDAARGGILSPSRRADVIARMFPLRWIKSSEYAVMVE